MAGEIVPGTQHLIYDEDNAHHAHLQHIKKSDVRVILVPQPSLTDPNDPLRWPTWKKWVVSQRLISNPHFEIQAYTLLSRCLAMA